MLPSRALAPLRLRLQSLRRALSTQPLVLWARRLLHGLMADHCLVRASALTYTTLLALVPLLAVVLALLKGAGFGDLLRPFLLERIPVVDPEVIDRILEYIDRANTQALGGVGFAALVLSCWAMLSNMEGTLNHIFGARRARGYLRRAGEYLSMIVVGALMVVLSIVVQTLLGSPTLFAHLLGQTAASGLARLALVLLPWVSVWASLVFLYAWVPNTRVPLRSVLVGALVGGTLFQLVQLGYIELQLGTTRYHAIYGALAQLPFLLVWVYLSWSVVLLGAEAAVALPTRTRIAWRSGASDRAAAGLDIPTLALHVLHRVEETFHEGRPPPGATDIADELGVRVRIVREAVEPLLRAGILAEADEGRSYLPAASPSALTLERVLRALRRGEI